MFHAGSVESKIWGYMFEDMADELFSLYHDTVLVLACGRAYDYEYNITDREFRKKYRRYKANCELNKEIIIGFYKKHFPLCKTKIHGKIISKKPLQQKEIINQPYNIKRLVDVIVYSTTKFKCRYPAHKVVDVNIFVPLIDPNGKEIEIRISGGYCPYCGTYFITTSDYEQLKFQGKISCQTFNNVYYRNYKSDSFLKPESIIHQYGYNVRQSESLSAKERQAILKTVMSDGILSNHEIRTHLEWLIRSNKERQDRDLAISKWQEDLAFLRNYKAESNPNYKAASIKHIHYEPR